MRDRRGPFGRPGDSLGLIRGRKVFRGDRRRGRRDRQGRGIRDGIRSRGRCDRRRGGIRDRILAHCHCDRRCGGIRGGILACCRRVGRFGDFGGLGAVDTGVKVDRGLRSRLGLGRGLSLACDVGPDILTRPDANPGDGSRLGGRLGGGFRRLARPGAAPSGLAGSGGLGRVEAQVRRPDVGLAFVRRDRVGTGGGMMGLRESRPVRQVHPGGPAGLRENARVLPKNRPLDPGAAVASRGPRGAVRIATTSSR